MSIREDIVSRIKGKVANDAATLEKYSHDTSIFERSAPSRATHKIFDPLNILNPGKKVGGTVEDTKRSMITHT